MGYLYAVTALQQTQQSQKKTRHILDCSRSEQKPSPCLICLDFTNRLVRRKWKLIPGLCCEGLVVTIYDRWESKHDLFLRKLAQMAGCWSRKKSDILEPGSLAYVGYMLIYILFPPSAEPALHQSVAFVRSQSSQTKCIYSIVFETVFEAFFSIYTQVIWIENR